MANDNVPTRTLHYNPDSERQRNGNRRRNAMMQGDAKEKLGQPMAAATRRLYKILILEFATQLGLHHCHQCSLPITDAANLSIEHKEPWRNSPDPVLMFFSVDNLALSHFGCNRAAGWKAVKPRQHHKAIWGRTVSRERYLEAYSYDPITGSLTWKIQSGRRIPGDPVGTKTKWGYFVANLDSIAEFSHNIIWLMQTGEWPGNEVDHENRVKSDNRWDNLRPATRSQQGANCPRAGKYKKGVAKNAKCSTFQANIKVQGKRIYLGCFKTEDEAHAAWLAAAIKHFGEFATAT